MTPDDPDFIPTAAFAEPDLPKRCLTCFYVLDHLPADRCPECGRPFNLLLSATYTTKPPFVRSRYWMPAFILAVILGVGSYLLLLPYTGFGWAISIAVPFMIGSLVGYATPAGTWGKIVLSVAVLVTCLLGLVANGSAGVFCFMILLIMAVVPIAVSVLSGVILRRCLKNSQWDQRHWLPILLLALLPPSVAVLELQFPRSPIVIVRTSEVIEASLPSTWEGVMFYEEVRHDPPWLLRLGLRSPLYTVGKMNDVGDRKTCVYTRGHLTKEITARIPLKRLDFVVVEQDMFEDYSVHLTGGSFQFEAVDANHTRVTLTTRYQPLLRPRALWQPVEEEVVHELHTHVMKGMSSEARRRDDVSRFSRSTAYGAASSHPPVRE